MSCTRQRLDTEGHPKMPHLRSADGLASSSGRVIHKAGIGSLIKSPSPASYARRLTIEATFGL
jgi:hypothetical protein